MQRPDSSAFGHGAASLSALHQPAAPCIRSRIADRAEHVSIAARVEGAFADEETRFEGKSLRAFQPVAMIFEGYRLAPTRRLSIGVQTGPLIGVEKGPPLFDQHTA
jgi:hypothetical protein